MPPRKRNSKTKPIRTSTSTRRARRDPQNNVHPQDPGLASCRDLRADTAIHPIHSLPPEILGQIFIFSLHIDSVAAAELHETLRHSGRHLQIFNPLVLCAVCSSWRSLAFATSQLWQRVYIHIPPSLKKAQAKRQATDLVRWIERSRSLPLALYISCENYPHGIVPNVPIISVLNDYAIRWKSVYFRDHYTTLQLRTSPMVPQLTLFQSEKWHIFLLQISFRYHVVVLDPFSWAELTHLQLHDHYINRQRVELIFMKSPKLVQLSIAVHPEFQPFGDSMSMILHNLVAFSLKMSCGSGYLLNHLSLPFLRDMFINRVSSQDIQPLLNFFTRSSCSLSKLEFYVQNLLPEDVLNILAHTSCHSLTSLKIFKSYSPQERVSVDDGVFQRLTLHQDDSLCPRLKFLTIDCTIECSPSALLKMVDSRVGYLTDEPIQYLHFRSIKCLSDATKLDEVGKKSGMEYTRRRHDHRGHYFDSVLLQKQGLERTQLLVNHGGFIFDQI